MFKAKKPMPEPNPIVLEAMRPVIDVALTLGPSVRAHIVYRHSRECVMTADPDEAMRLERAEAERLADHVARQSRDVVRAAFALSAAARYLAGTAAVLHEQHASRHR